MCAAEPAVCGVCAVWPPPHPTLPTRANSRVCVFLAKPLGPFCTGRQTGGRSVSSHILGVLKKSDATEPPSGHTVKLQQLTSSGGSCPTFLIFFLCRLSALNDPFIVGVVFVLFFKQTDETKHFFSSRKIMFLGYVPFEFESKAI